MLIAYEILLNNYQFYKYYLYVIRYELNDNYFIESHFIYKLS